MLNNEIGSQLKNLRERKGLTIERVAYAVDEIPSEVEFWESGKLKPCADAKRKLEFLFSCFGDDHKELAKVNEENYSDFFNYPECIDVPENSHLGSRHTAFSLLQPPLDIMETSVVDFIYTLVKL